MAQSERELLERFLHENDQAAFQGLIDRHGPMVLGVCRSVLGELHDAEDAFQTTFLVLVQKGSTIRSSDSLGPWLHRVALRIARRARARACSRRACETHGSRLESESGPTGEPADCLSPQLIRDELRRLPERYRLPVILCYLEGKTNEQAAAQLDWPIGTVKGRLWRARGRLRERLGRRGLAPSGWSPDPLC